MEKSETKKVAFQGNFPVDQHEVESVDANTGEVLFVQRISSQMRFLDDKGREMPDPRPMSPALGDKPQMPIRDYIRSLVHSEALQRELDAQGHETFEEADDFEVGDDYFPDSQYENEMDPSIAELVRAGTASLSAKAAGEAKSKAAALAASRARRQESDDSDSPPLKTSKKAPKGRADPAQTDLEDTAE